jgi:hypothetical protein
MRDGQRVCKRDVQALLSVGNETGEKGDYMTREKGVSIKIALAMFALIVILIALLFSTKMELWQAREQLLNTADSINGILCRPIPADINYVNTFNYTCDGDTASWVQLPKQIPQSQNIGKKNNTYHIGGLAA